jgi:hypothetical protein
MPLHEPMPSQKRQNPKQNKNNNHDDNSVHSGTETQVSHKGASLFRQVNDSTTSGNNIG